MYMKGGYYHLGATAGPPLISSFIGFLPLNT